MRKKFVLVLVAAFCISFIFSNSALASKLNNGINEHKSKTQDGVPGEEDYYSETLYIDNINELDEIDNEDISDEITSTQERYNLQFVAASVMKVYVIENLDEDKNVVSSHLMNEEEVNQYKRELNQTTRLTSVGSDSESKGELDIYLSVSKNTSNQYYVYGDADWTNGTWLFPDGYNRPSSGDDFIALTWGGNGELKQLSKSISGDYQNDQGSISFSRAKSDTYAGYCWQFAETKTVNLLIHYANHIDSYVKIGKTYSTLKNKETSVKMTYIHTYQSTVGSISFEGGTSSAAASVSLSSTSNSWQIEIDVPDIVY